MTERELALSDALKAVQALEPQYGGAGGRYVESRTLERAQAAIKSLMAQSSQDSEQQ